MVYASRLQPIEEALAALGGSSGSAAPKAPPASSAPPKAAPPKQAEPVRAEPVSAGPISNDTRSRLHEALLEAKQTHIADALEQSSLNESATELVFTTPKMYVMYLKQADFEATVRRVLGKPFKITIKAGEPAAEEVPLAAGTPAKEDEVTTRALSHPEVRRFQEIFPDSQVRTVRNLKEG